MSRQLISRSPDLQRLENEGYAVDVRGGYLLISDVPYVTADRVVRRGTLVSTLDLSNDATVRPTTHVVWFAGEYPSRLDGSPISEIGHASATAELLPGFFVQHSFSNKPAAGYADYYEKMTRYIDILSHPACAIDPTAIPQTFRPRVSDTEQSPFTYVDTATSRAGIGAFAAKLEGLRLAIVGLGGTGSYVLDLVAKSPVSAIHLYDDDVFVQHNAFRSPGAIGIADLEQQVGKAAFFAERYGRMKRGIVAHPYRITADNVLELAGVDFVFVCVDDSAARRVIVEALVSFDVPFADVGMGVFIADAGLGGVLRVTSSTSSHSAHILGPHRIPGADGGAENAYDRNIQIVELNALNAALAVLRFKKHIGFYLDLEAEHHTTFTIDGNMLVNEEHA